MARYDPIQEAARRQRLQRERAEERLLRQRRSKCGVSDGLIADLNSDLSVLRVKRERRQQKWRDISIRRARVRDPKVIADITAEQREIRSIVDQIDQRIRSMESRLAQYRNDYALNQCSAL